MDWFVDLTGSAGAGNGTSFANRSSNLVSIFNGASAGDVIRVKETPIVNIGSCTWTKDSTIVLPANTTKDIYLDGAWVGATNVTGSANATLSQRKQGASAGGIVFASGFSFGRAAYYDLGSSQDFSAYSKVSFWFRSSIAIADMSALYYLALCSDATGTTVVDTLQFPAYNIPANTLVPITIDKGSALGASIRSVALYTYADPGTPTLVIDNIFAANDLTLHSLISKYAAAEGWFSLRSVTNIGGSNIAEIDQGINSTANISTKGYPGITESVTTYVSNGFNTPAAAATTTVVYTLAKAGAAGSQITLSGGWASADMATRTGYTHLNGRNSLGRMFQNTQAYNLFEYLMFSHGNTGVIIGTDNTEFQNCVFSGNYAAGISVSGTRTVVVVDTCSFSCNNNGYSAALRKSQLSNCQFYNNASDHCIVSGNFSKVTNCRAENGGAAGFYSNGSASLTIENCYAKGNSAGLEVYSLIGGVVRNLECVSNTSAGLIIVTCEITLYDLITTSNGAGGGTAITDNGAAGALVQLFNWTKNEATAVAALNDYDGNRYISINEDGTPGNHIIRTEGGLIFSQTAVRHTASGIAWQIQPTSLARDVDDPMIQNLKGIPVKAGVSHTVSVWVRRSNTGLTLKFGVADQGNNGIAAAEVAMTAVADTWEQLSLTFTPTVDCVVDFYIAAYGGTTYSGFWDDFAVSAASKLDTSSGDYAYVGNGAYLSNSGGGSAPVTTSHFSLG